MTGEKPLIEEYSYYSPSLHHPCTMHHALCTVHCVLFIPTVSQTQAATSIINFAKPMPSASTHSSCNDGRLLAAVCTDKVESTLHDPSPKSQD